MVSFEWQKKCLDIWSKNGCRGIVNVVTGAGKTYFALSCIKHLTSISEKELAVKIIVPQVFLVSQWIREIVLHLEIRRSDIGVYYGSKKDSPEKNYMIYVVNSARYSISKHIINDMDNGKAVLLIADECHHYCSKENAKVFAFYDYLNPRHSYYALGLSATPDNINYDIIQTSLGIEIFKYSFADALATQIISEFMLINIELSFTSMEASEYDELSDELLRKILVLKRLCPDLNNLKSEQYFARLSELAHSYKSSEISDLANTVLNLMYKRKSIVHKAQERINCTVNLVDLLDDKAKIIIFCERIETADTLYQMLNKQHRRQVGIYHSEMNANVRKHVLQKYQHSEIRILITCKALDEGLNVPSTDIGIVVSSTGSMRQRIQRLGRILRRNNGKKRLYYMFVAQSNEDSELINSFSGLLPYDIFEIDIQYNGGTFYNKEYQKYVSRIFSLHRNKFDKANLFNEVSENLKTALVRCDWFQSEDSCRKLIQSAQTTAEKNYWISILYLILAICSA